MLAETSEVKLEREVVLCCGETDEDRDAHGIAHNRSTSRPLVTEDHSVEN